MKTELTPYEIKKAKMRKTECLLDGLYFNRYFFKQVFLSKMIIALHHKAIQSALDRTMLPPDHPDFIARLIINIPPGYGKCTDENDMVLTGEGYVRAGDVEEAHNVAGYEDGKLVYRPIRSIEHHRKQRMNIKLRSGRDVNTTPDHPVLTQRGWVKAEDLNKDDYLIRLCSQVDGAEPIDEDELVFVTMMMFDGCCRDKAYSFTNNDKCMVDMMVSSAKALGIDVYRQPCKKSYEYYVSRGEGKTKELLQKYGIHDCLSINKRLPQQFYNLSLEQKFKFLGLAFATDGWVSKIHGSVNITLASEGLIKDISLLMDSCGIPNSYYEYENDHNGAYTICVNPHHITPFLDKIDFHHKTELLHTRLKEKSHTKSLVFGYPREVFKGLTGKCKNIRPRIKTPNKSCTVTDYTYQRLKNEIDPSLNWEMDDFIYDRVIETNHLSKGIVVHIEVDNNNYDDQNYIANGLVVHNTLQAVINYIARGLAINPSNRFLHLSYSANLALQNSEQVRQIVKSQAFQEMWQVKTKDSVDSKSLWQTEQMGGVYATAAGGQVTGFRAGHMDDTRFTGALIIDDPLKPDDANYDTKREVINNRFKETISSRLAIESVPMVVIMQRLHYNDLSGFLLRGGSGEQWYHLNLPVKIDRTVEYPEEYTHGIPLEHDIPDGWLWEMKHNDKHETALRAHRRAFMAQYMQAPIRRNEELALWSEDLLNSTHLDVFDTPERTIVSVDPAVSNNDTSDLHGIIVSSRHGTNRYTVDADYTRGGSPMDWARTAIMAYDKHKADAIVIEVNQGGDMCEQTLRNAGFEGRIIRTHASKGKIARAEPIAALYEQGFVKHKAGLSDLEDEMLDLDPLTGKSGGKSPNRVDALVWGLTNLSQGMEMNELLRLVVNN